MGLNWPTAAMHGSHMADGVEQQVHDLLDEFGDLLTAELDRIGMPRHNSPLLRPFGIVVVRDQTKLLVGMLPGGGMATMQFIDDLSNDYAPDAMVQLVQGQMGQSLVAVLVLPRPDSPVKAAQLQIAAQHHVSELVKATTIGRLGDLTGLGHLEPHLHQFLEDHPDPERNVFVMMRFAATPQMAEIYESIKSALAVRGMTAVRADERDYTGELWSNIEVYLTGCRYGIAVFEDVDQRDYNPNVSLELGYLMGRRKRTLLLKEKRLPKLPSDVVHRLYKEFDIFDIKTSVEAEVGRWVDVDLRLRF